MVNFFNLKLIITNIILRVKMKKNQIFQLLIIMKDLVQLVKKIIKICYINK